MLFLKLVRIIRAQKKNRRADNKSQSATITQNQEISSLSLLTQPSKTTQPQHPIPLFPEHKNTLSNNKARKFIHKNSRLTLEVLPRYHSFLYFCIIRENFAGFRYSDIIHIHKQKIVYHSP